MKLKLRLYKYHDPELVQIYRLQSVDFEQLTLNCLRAFVQNKTFRYRMDMNGSCRPAKRVYQLTINIDIKQDSDIYELLQRVSDGCLNIFVKTILKWYLSDPMPDIFIKNKEDMDYFKQKYTARFYELPDIHYIEQPQKAKKRSVQKAIKPAKPSGEKLYISTKASKSEGKTGGFADSNKSEKETLNQEEPIISVSEPNYGIETAAENEDITNMFLSLTQG